MGILTELRNSIAFERGELRFYYFFAFAGEDLLGDESIERIFLDISGYGQFQSAVVFLA